LSFSAGHAQWQLVGHNTKRERETEGEGQSEGETDSEGESKRERGISYICQNQGQPERHPGPLNDVNKVIIQPSHLPSLRLSPSFTPPLSVTNPEYSFLRFHLFHLSIPLLHQFICLLY
jgi:hypothetical protein